jgi:hypothetical protein
MSCPCLNIDIYYNNPDIRVNLPLTVNGQYDGVDQYTFDVELIAGSGVFQTLYVLRNGFKGWRIQEQPAGTGNPTTWGNDINFSSADCPIYDYATRNTTAVNFRWDIGDPRSDIAWVSVYECPTNECCITVQVRHNDGTYSVEEAEIITPNRSWSGAFVRSFQLQTEGYNDPPITMYMWKKNDYRWIVSDETEGVARAASGVSSTYFQQTGSNPVPDTDCPSYGNGVRLTKYFYTRS